MASVGVPTLEPEKFATTVVAEVMRTKKLRPGRAGAGA